MMTTAIVSSAVSALALAAQDPGAGILQSGASDRVLEFVLWGLLGQAVVGVVAIIGWFFVVRRFMVVEWPAQMASFSGQLGSLGAKVDHLDTEVGKLQVEAGKHTQAVEGLHARIARVEDWMLRGGASR